jgi:glycosyltransferase involved in cell wall biosynthesis
MEIDTTIFTGSYRPCVKKVSNHLEIVYLPMYRFPPRHIWFQILNFSTLRYKLEDYEIVHGVSPNASFGLAFPRRKITKPFVASVHDDPRSKLKGFANQAFSSMTLKDFGLNFVEFPMYDFSTLQVLHNSDSLVFCSNSLLSQIKASYGNFGHQCISVIPNGIDVDEIDRIDGNSQSKDDSITIVYAGRLFWFKGITFLLDAFGRIMNFNSKVKLKIFGTGPLEQEIEKFIHVHNAANKVDFRGYAKTHEEVLAGIKSSQIVVFPSLSEAQSIFMLEAMACKKPLIAFDLPFASEIITHMNTGLLAKAGDAEDLARKIQLLIDDPNLRLRLGNAAYAHVKKNHNWRVQVEKYVRVYKQLAEQN